MTLFHFHSFLGVKTRSSIIAATLDFLLLVDSERNMYDSPVVMAQPTTSSVLPKEDKRHGMDHAC